MSIVGGLDIHRKQLTFDYLDTVTGQVQRGQVSPADREHLRAWLARFAGRGDVAFAAEGCTGWRYVAGELAAAGIAVHLAEPADTAAARGRKRRAKTDRTDARHLRQLLAEGRLPECWIPPARILECRALLELYHDLRREHTAWLQRIHAVFFHQGAPALGERALTSARGLAAVQAAAAAHLSPAGQVQVATAVEMMTVLEGLLHGLRHRLLDAAGQLAGAQVLAERLYGVGPPPRARRSGSPGWTSPSTPPTPSGPPAACPGRGRRCCAGPPTRPARPTPAPRPPTTPTTPPSGTARTASAPRCRRPARSSARPATSWPSSATTRSPPPEPPGDRSRGTPERAGARHSRTHRWGTPAASSLRPAVSRCRPGRATRTA